MLLFAAESGLASAGARPDKPPGVFKAEVTEIQFKKKIEYGSKLLIMEWIYRHAS